MTEHPQDAGMRLAALTSAERRQIYNEHMKEDFPASELKTLEMIEQGITKGYYQFLGLKKRDEIIGYACLITAGDTCLVDYLAVISGQRSRGAGSELLRLLGDYLQDREFVLVEVENPRSGNDEAERALRKRRMAFYLCGGLQDTGVDVRCFGVDFRILKAPRRKPQERADIIRRYQAVYRMILPEELFRNNIRTEPV